MPSTTDIYDRLHIPTIHFNTLLPSTLYYYYHRVYDRLHITTIHFNTAMPSTTECTTDFIFQPLILIPQCHLLQTSTTDFIFQPFISISQCRLPFIIIIITTECTTDFIFQPFTLTPQCRLPQSV